MKKKGKMVVIYLEKSIIIISNLLYLIYNIYKYIIIVFISKYNLIYNINNFYNII